VQLEIVEASLKDDPDNAELLALKDELDQMIQLLDESIADLNPTITAPPKPAPVQQAPPPPPPEEKWSRENHPAFKKAAPPAEDKEPEAAQVISYQVNDTVMAKWLSGDKGFYPARITSVTGSKTAPIYTVKFKSYDTTETLRIKDIRPVAAQKRKADGAPVAPGVPPPPPTTQPLSPRPGAPVASGSGAVLSAAPSLYPQVPKPEGELGEDGKPKPKFKKIKANKELEKGKNKWQEFNQKGKLGKSAKKDSMFRTPDGVGGRVGFIGSGQTMRKDPTRSRHIYQANEELD
jgi:survival of motor neuron-related-splicing factor 30